MDRRQLIMSVGAASSVGVAGAATSPGDAQLTERLQAHMQRYLDFGLKLTGGGGEKAAGAWIAASLSELGYSVSRQSIAAPNLTVMGVSLIAGEGHADLAAMARMPNAQTLSGPLRVTSLDTFETASAAGAVVAVHLRRQRWSSALHPEVQACVGGLRAARAKAIVLITHGPTGERLSLNAPFESETLGLSAGVYIDTPTFMLAPRDWRRLQPRSTVSISFASPGAVGESFNVVGALGDAHAPAIVVSTPRTGWGPCGGERGPGVALFLELASTLRRYARRHRIVTVCTAAHEFEDAGAHAFLNSLAPAPAATALWLHLGAGIAARDWHEVSEQLLPLPSADSQRFLLVDPGAIEAARAAFSGLSGLEQPYPTSGEAQGELRGVLRAGYAPVVGLLGAHRFHHAPSDDARCFNGALLAPVLNSLNALADAMLQSA